MIIVDYYEMVSRVFSGDFQITFFSGPSIMDDSFPQIISILELLDATLNYDNIIYSEKIVDLKNAYYSNNLELAISIFHLIEKLFYNEQICPVFCYKFTPNVNYQFVTGSFIINCNQGLPLSDTNLRLTLSYLVDRDLYKDTFYNYTNVSSHLFGWS